MGYPQEVKHWGVDVYMVERLTAVILLWVMKLEIRLVGGLSVLMMIQLILFLVVLYTSGVFGRVTTIYGEKYSLREYATQTTNSTRVEYVGN